MAQDRLQVVLEYAVNDSPVSAINSSMRNISKMANSTSEQLRKMTGFAVGVGVALTGSMIAFGKSSISAASESIEASTKLSAVLKNVKGVTDEQVDSIKNYAGELQKLGVVDGDVAISGMQQLGTFQLQADTLKKLMPGMADLLAQQNGVNASSGDAVNIGNLLGKVMNGQVGALSRVGISFNEAQERVLKYGTESEKASILSKVLQENVGGVNAALLETDGGKIAQAKIQFGDMQETIGAMLLPVLGELASWFTGKIPIIQESLVKVYSKFLELQTPLMEIMGKLKDFSNLILENEDIIMILAGGITAYYIAAGIANGVMFIQQTYMKFVVGYAWAMNAANGQLTVSQYLLNTALSANPIGMIVLGLTAIVVALVLAYKKSETFRTYVDAAWATIKDFGAGIMNLPEKIKQMWGNGIEKVQEFWDKIQGLWLAITSNPFAQFALDILSLMNPITAIIQHFDKLKEGWNWIKDKVGLGDDKNTTTTKTTTAKPVGSHRTGESFVKNDGMYKLHYGERVLTKAENSQYSQGGVSSSPSINISISAVQELGNEIKRAIEPVIRNVIKKHQTEQLMKMGIAGGQ